MELLGRVFQSLIKQTQDKGKFWFEFCNFAVRLSAYIVGPFVLSFNNLKLHKTKAVKKMSITSKQLLALKLPRYGPVIQSKVSTWSVLKQKKKKKKHM